MAWTAFPVLRTSKTAANAGVRAIENFMSNIYDPPKSEVFETQPKGPRPTGIAVISVLFILFSLASTLIAYIEVDGEWEIVLGSSLVLIFLLRGVFIGKDNVRKTGVFIGFFIAAMDFFGFYEESFSYADIQSAMYVAEGLFAAIAATYLLKIKGNPFFNE